jgi:hypothetical protein
MSRNDDLIKGDADVLWGKEKLREWQMLWVVNPYQMRSRTRWTVPPITGRFR